MPFLDQLYHFKLFFFSQQYLDRYVFLFPLGIIGVWRWSVWIMKEIVGLHYHPKTKKYDASVSLVIPVYNENPQLFTQALASWKRNNPAEIIAVIDFTDTKCITIFKTFAKTFPGAKLIITRVPGKRPALALGIQKAKSDIIALVDSDTIWDSTVIRNGLPPFHDPKVAGVATYQSVLHPTSFAQKIFDVQLDLRYRHEYPFLAGAGNALVCLSGRTAFYRKDVILPMVYDLTHETFFGRPIISGDDKCLTYLVLKAGWKVAYQSNSHVYTPGMQDLSSYLKQRLRWSRNSLRSDIKAIAQGWPIHHKALLFYQIDKFLQSFAVILSPIFLALSLYYHLWITAVVIFCWWFVSRTIKMYSHLVHKPDRFSIVPGYVFYSFFSGVVRIYAFFTLNTQGWITRWDKSRMPQLRFISDVPAYAATACVIALLTYGVFLYKQHMYLIPSQQHEALISRALLASTKPITPENLTDVSSTQKHLLTKRYTTQQGETLISIAQKLHEDATRLFQANNASIGFVEQRLPKGMIITIPGKDMELIPQPKFADLKEATTPIAVHYDKKTNTLVVSGRGKTVTLSDIKKNGGNAYMQEESPKIWHMTASIFLYTGVTLHLDKNEVTWLKMESNPNTFTMIRSRDGNIDIHGVKVTSWDTEKNDYDKDIKDGRSFVMVKDNARMDIYDAEMAYLGYATSPDLTVSPYGVSWKLSRSGLKHVMLTGEVINSTFHDNYFGTYTFGATGITWRGNEFYANVRYGLDPHDDSDGFLVENNYSHNNGTHGIIFSKRCMYNTIRNNVSVDNGLHGIMLHEQSNNNLVENNTVDGNISGIALWHSSNNIVRNNRIDKNRHGIRANAGANNNQLVNNTITNSSYYGFYIYDNANNNYIAENTLSDDHVGMYIKSDENTLLHNKLYNNNIGIYFLSSASKNSVHDNTVQQSLVYGIYTKVENSVSNLLGDNALAENRKDVSGEDLKE